MRHGLSQFASLAPPFLFAPSPSSSIRSNSTPPKPPKNTQIMSSWADIAAKNAPPEELQAHPDPNLLERKEDHPSHKGEAAVDYEGEHVHGEAF